MHTKVYFWGLESVQNYHWKKDGHTLVLPKVLIYLIRSGYLRCSCEELSHG